MAEELQFRIDGLPDQQAIEERSRELCEEVGGAQALIRSLGWSKVRDYGASALREEFAKQDGLTWLAQAWTFSKELKSAAAETLDGVPERRIALAGHSISQQVFPTIKLSCGALSLDLDFTLDLAADIKCASLVVRHGSLVAIQTGQLNPSASLSLGKIEICRKACPAIDLVKPFPLPGDGLVILRDAPAAGD